MHRVTLRASLLMAALAVVFVAGAPGVARAEDAAAGEKVFAAQKCSMCHSVAGKGGKMSALDGVGSKLTAAADHDPLSIFSSASSQTFGSSVTAAGRASSGIVADDSRPVTCNFIVRPEPDAGVMPISSGNS